MIRKLLRTIKGIKLYAIWNVKNDFYTF